MSLYSMKKLKCRRMYGDTYCYYEDKHRGTTKEFIDPEEPSDPIPVPKKKKKNALSVAQAYMGAGTGTAAVGAVAKGGYEMYQYRNTSHLDKAIKLTEKIEEGGHSREALETMEEELNTLFDKAGSTGSTGLKVLRWKSGSKGLRWLRKSNSPKSISRGIGDTMDDQWFGSEPLDESRLVGSRSKYHPDILDYDDADLDEDNEIQDDGVDHEDVLRSLRERLDKIPDPERITNREDQEYAMKEMEFNPNEEGGGHAQ